MDDAALLDALAGTWSATSAVLHAVSPARWEDATGCPGWTVKDQLSYLVWSAGIRAALGLEADRMSPAAQHSVTKLVGAWKAKAAEAPAIDVVIDDVEHRLGTGEVRRRVQLRFDDLVTRGAGRQRDVDPPIVSGDGAAVDRMLGLLPVTP